MRSPLVFCVMLAAALCPLRVVARGADGTTPLSDSTPCYRYDRDTISLAGTLTWRIYPGRPNYESVEQGDQPDTVVVLQLKQPFCTQASDDFDGHQAVREVQLIVPWEDFHFIVRRPKSRARLAGTLSGAVWGWHH